MRCREVRAALHDYVEELLAPETRRALEAHLSGCAECRAELESWDRALGHLTAAATATEAPDLWNRFQARLAAEAGPLTCTEAHTLLPALDDPVLTGAEAAALAAHLSACAACRREQARLGHAMQALDGAAPALPAPDLWPAFVRRLEQERAARRPWDGWQAVLEGLFAPRRAGWHAPALALGALVLLAALLHGSHPGTPRRIARNLPPQLPAASPAPRPWSRIEEPATRAAAPPGPHAARRAIRTAQASRRAARREGVRLRPALPLRLARSEAPLRAPVRRARVTARREGIRIAGKPNLPSPEFGAVPATEPVRPPESSETTRAARAEVVQAVTMLAGFEDSAQRPFEMDQDDR